MKNCDKHKSCNFMANFLFTNVKLIAVKVNIENLKVCFVSNINNASALINVLIRAIELKKFILTAASLK